MSTTTITSRHGQWLQFCASHLISSKLADIADGSVVVRKFPWNRNLITANIRAGLFITLGNKIKSDTAYGGLIATNQSKVVGYGAQITLVKASNQDLAFDDTWTAWRERAEAMFETTRMPARGSPAAAGISWVANILIEQGPTIDAGAFTNQYDVQAFMVRAVCRELRGSLA